MNIKCQGLVKHRLQDCGQAAAAVRPLPRLGLARIAARHLTVAVRTAGGGRGSVSLGQDVL